MRTTHDMTNATPNNQIFQDTRILGADREGNHVLKLILEQLSKQAQKP